MSEKIALLSAEEELEAIGFAAHMPEDYPHGLASWINQELYANFIGLKISRHIGDAVRAGILSFPGAPMSDLNSELRATLDAQRGHYRELLETCAAMKAAGDEARRDLELLEL